MSRESEEFFAATIGIHDREVKVPAASELEQFVGFFQRRGEWPTGHDMAAGLQGGTRHGDGGAGFARFDADGLGPVITKQFPVIAGEPVSEQSGAATVPSRRVPFRETGQLEIGQAAEGVLEGTVHLAGRVSEEGSANDRGKILRRALDRFRGLLVPRVRGGKIDGFGIRYAFSVRFRFRLHALLRGTGHGLLV